jgi:hypothetical protein
MRDSVREPPLEELIEDPLTQLLMERDGVDPRDLRRLLLQQRRAWFGVEEGDVGTEWPSITDAPKL